ncbi:hypothetical protein FNV43_RR05309 [Rhamnella rubrinervis]|uniref:CCT domain-containing protein n=1 Tax=Rhamnella rubrinervis TaxID=2594499 RepID=A0A8K0HL37_9ROSA|nr:hypothetical protein FNV43_RR05309 [Rhamnella rubrinervis]
MGYSSFLKSPKKEEQQVPDTLVTKFSYPRDDQEEEEDVDIMDDLERILGIEEEEDEKPLRDIMYSSRGQLNWDLMDWDELGNGEEQEELDIQEEDDKKLVFEKEISKCFFEEESYLMNKKVIVKRESSDGFWNIDADQDNKSVSLNLNLNYQEVLDAWSDRGSLWAHDFSLPMPPVHAYYMGEVPVMEEEKSTRREASVLRYKEKRQSRLFSKKIRYQVRKLNADKRPRLKGRFVKRVS